MEANDTRLSSLMDTWLLLREIESGAERNRVLHLLKSRGMAHSNQIREFLLTDHGVELRDVYLGPSGFLLTGSALMVQHAHEQAQAVEREQEAGAKKRELEHKRRAMEAQIAALQAEFEIEQLKALRVVAQEEARATVLTDDRVQMAKQRQADAGKARKSMHQKSARLTMKTRPKRRSSRRIGGGTRRAVDAAALCCGTDAQFDHGIRQPETHLRGTPERTLQHRGN